MPFLRALLPSYEFKGEKSGRVSDRDSPGPGLSFPQARLFISGAGLPLFPSLDCGPWPLSACPPVWPCCLSVFGIFLFLGGQAPAVQVLGGGAVLGHTAVPAALPTALRTPGQGCMRLGSPCHQGNKIHTDFMSP